MNKLGKGLLVPAIMAVGLVIPAQADAAREVRTLNDGWSFAMQGDKDFKPVNVPHTWNSDAYQTRDYVRGTGIYRRTVKLPADMQGKRVLLRPTARQPIRWCASMAKLSVRMSEATPRIFLTSPHI